jgi:hypothetical protein
MGNVVQEIAMAKAKKRVAAYKRSAKRVKASAKPARKKAAKKVMPKKAKSKVKRTSMSAKKPAANKKQSPETMDRRKGAEMAVDTIMVKITEESAPDVVMVSEHESVETAISVSAGGELERGEGIAPADAST